jgi:hypothetical protein
VAAQVIPAALRNEIIRAVFPVAEALGPEAIRIPPDTAFVVGAVDIQEYARALPEAVAFPADYLRH